MLAMPACRLVTILGPGGIGKTRLALTAAHKLAVSFEAAALVALAPVDRADDILTITGTALGLSLGSEPNAVLDALRNRNPHLLLVFDNFEQLLPDGAPVLESILNTAPRVRCIVTSREALNTRWEWRFDLQELTYPPERTDTDASSFSSVQLFLQIARRTRPRHPLERTEFPHVMRICRLVGGMPLGVELAAAQLGSMPCAAIAEQLAQGVERLTASLRDLPPRQRSLLAGFETSWAGLTPEEQCTLACLSVIRGEFTLEAALAVATATIADVIRLVDKSLVRSTGIDRYSLHEVIRRLATRKLDRLPGGSAVPFARYLDYYVAWAKEGLRRLTESPYATHGAEELVDNHFQHLWFIWAGGAEMADRTAVAVAMVTYQQAYRATLHGDPLRRDTLSVLQDSLEEFTHTTSISPGVILLDLVWLPMIADKLADLTAEFAHEAASTFPALVGACSIDGRLRAFPFHVNLGLLYCRSDLLDKYGYAAPPATWDELAQMAATIQAGERAAGAANFWGYIWPGQRPEALMCVSLEWLHSEGGGSIIEPDGRVSIANPRAAAALNRAAGWVGAISPPDFTNQTLATARASWDAGNAAFMRMWSAFEDRSLLGNMADVTKITLLPSGSLRRAGTLGGAPLAIRKESEQHERAIDLIRERASERAQRLSALRSLTNLPARFALYDDPELLAIDPIFSDVRDLIANGGMTIRPNNIAGRLYPQVATAYAQTVAAVLSGQAEAAPALAELARTLTALGGWPSD